MYLLDISRKEIKAALNFKDIKDVVLERKENMNTSNDKLKIIFKKEMNGVKLNLKLLIFLLF